MFENLPEIMTPRQLADYLLISEMTVKRAMKSGKLKAFKAGRDWRIERKAVPEWVKIKRE